MTRQRAFANKEREAQARRMSKLARAVLLSTATLLSFAAVGLLLADQLYRPDTFIVERLKIKGNLRHLKPVEIETIVNKHGSGNFFSTELRAIKAQIEALAWVQSAEVRREWPNTLLVQVREHRPVMRWKKNKWVNSAGEVIDLPEGINLANPITLSGNKKDAKLMLQQAAYWEQRLALADLDLRFVELSGSHAWTLGLRHARSGAEFKLLLGREQVEERLTRFQYLFDKQFKQAGQVLERVDARYPDGLAIKARKIKSNIESNHDIAMHSDGLAANN